MNSHDARKVKRVIGQEHEVHACQEGRKERQHALRLALVTSVAEAVKARRRGAKIDHDKKERRQGVKPKIGADPRQADRQDNGGRRSVSRPYGRARRRATQAKGRGRRHRQLPWRPSGGATRTATTARTSRAASHSKKSATGISSRLYRLRSRARPQGARRRSHFVGARPARLRGSRRLRQLIRRQHSAGR